MKKDELEQLMLDGAKETISEWCSTAEDIWLVSRYMMSVLDNYKEKDGTN